MEDKQLYPEVYVDTVLPTYNIPGKHRKFLELVTLKEQKKIV